MNARQRLAISRPLARATDPTAPFTREHAIGGVRVSTILSVNK